MTFSTRLVPARFFSAIDLAAGYWQVGLEADAQLKATFITARGIYELVIMPFGLCNTPATFQPLMNHVLRGLKQG